MIHYALIFAITSYLLGSIPFGYLLVRIFRGQDVRQTGSGNIGATNVARTGSKGLAIATLVLDALKGYVAVAHVFHWSAHYPDVDLHIVYAFAAFAGLCALIGHMFPVWLRFKGGKGVATGLGSFLAIAPAAVGAVLVVFLAIVAMTRHVSLGSIVASALFPLAAWWLKPETRTPLILALMAAASLLIIWRHKDNIRRLLAGNENKLGAKKEDAA